MDEVKEQQKVIRDYVGVIAEVAATLEAARQGWPTRRLVLVFQPHRYTRTRDLLDDFGRVLSARLSIDPGSLIVKVPAQSLPSLLRRSIFPV